MGIRGGNGDFALLAIGADPAGGGEVEAREALELPRDCWLASGDDFRESLRYPSCAGGVCCSSAGSTGVNGVDELLPGRRAAGLDPNWPLALLVE